MVNGQLKQEKPWNLICKLFLLNISILMLVGCSHLDSTIPSDVSDSRMSIGIDQYEETKKIDSGKNYTVYEVYDDNAESAISYIVEILDDSGRNWFNAKIDFPEPNVTLVSEEVIEIEKPTGTGFSEVQYFDVKNRAISPKYNVAEPSLFIDGKLIQCGSGNGTRVTVTTVFDETEGINNLLIDSESYTIETIRLIDEQTIEVVYLRFDEGDKLEKKVVLITADQLK